MCCATELLSMCVTLCNMVHRYRKNERPALMIRQPGRVLALVTSYHIDVLFFY